MKSYKSVNVQKIIFRNYDENLEKKSNERIELFLIDTYTDFICIQTL